MAGMTNCAPTSLSREGKEAAVVKRSCTLYLLGKREGRTGINIIYGAGLGYKSERRTDGREHHFSPLSDAGKEGGAGEYGN